MKYRITLKTIGQKTILAESSSMKKLYNSLFICCHPEHFERFIEMQKEKITLLSIGQYFYEILP